MSDGHFADVRQAIDAGPGKFREVQPDTRQGFNAPHGATRR